MKTYVKIFSSGILICLTVIYLVTMPVTNKLVILEPTFETQTDVIINDDSEKVTIGFKDNKPVIEPEQLDTDLYNDPYLNIKYRIDSDEVDDFDENSYILNSSHDSDPMKLNSFDQEKSDRIGSFRQLIDSRHYSCSSHPNWENLPATSIIMTFYNEARSALLRSVTSVLKRTPEHLLSDIVLVDDCSDDPAVGNLLKGLHPKIKVLRNIERQGLVRSRMYGALNADGPVLTFLDSHVECNVDWLQPLLYQLTQKPRGIVSPIIDPIKAETLEYRVASSNIKGKIR